MFSRLRVFFFRKNFFGFEIDMTSSKAGFVFFCVKKVLEKSTCVAFEIDGINKVHRFNDSRRLRPKFV